ncbi:MAG: T9SS type A sorting domain-containing protein, partial [Bacteroidota bacterium]
DGQVFTFDISGIVNLDISNENIADLSGIQDFTALTTLNCSMNQLTDLDFTDNNNLTTLLCNNNQLISLNVTANSSLQSLSCQQNQLNSLNLRDLFVLTDFNSTANPLTCIAVNGRIRAVLNIGIYTNWLVDDNTVYRLDCETPMLIAAKSPAITAIPIKALSFLPKVQLYPNPVKDRLQIILPKSEKLTRVVIYDLHGEQVLTTQFGTIDIQGLQEGLYIVAIQIANSQEFVYKKMVISNR